MFYAFLEDKTPLIVNEKMTWVNASQHCFGLGGHIFEVRTQEAFDIGQQLKNEFEEPDVVLMWLGGRLNITRDEWMWSSNSDIISRNASFWGFEGAIHETGYECMLLFPDLYYRAQCDRMFYFVCEFI